MTQPIYKKAEDKIKQWLDRPELGYSFDRIPDQLGGLYGGRNICDFICFKSPYMFYIESKETQQDRFNFSMISETQYKGLMAKSRIENCFGLIIALFSERQKAFIFRIQDIDSLQKSGKKSVNVTKQDKWTIPYIEVPTVPSRKELLDYTGDLVSMIEDMFVNCENEEFHVYKRKDTDEKVR